MHVLILTKILLVLNFNIKQPNIKFYFEILPVFEVKRSQNLITYRKTCR